MAESPSRKRWLRWGGIGLLVVVTLCLGGWYWAQRDNGAQKYQTAAVTRGDLTQSVTATGQLNPVTNVQVGCQISGTIQKLFVDFNSSVTQAQVVAQIDAATYQANLLQAEGDLANAKAALELAQINAGRSKDLFTIKLIPQSDYDQTIANLHQAEATVKIK